MRKIGFKLVEKSRAGKVYLQLDFAGGDADTEHPEEDGFDDVNWDNYKDKLNVIEEKYSKYKILKDLLDYHDNKTSDVYQEIKEEHGEEIAKLYENAPNDPQSDYQFKCYLSSISLIAYDDEGNKYESFL